MKYEVIQNIRRYAKKQAEKENEEFKKGWWKGYESALRDLEYGQIGEILYQIKGV